MATRSERLRSISLASAAVAARSAGAHRRCLRELDDRMLHHDDVEHAGRGPSGPVDLLQARRSGRDRRRPGTSSSRRRRAFSATPTRSPHCTSADFALDQLPSRLAGRADHGLRQPRRRTRNTCWARRRSSSSSRPGDQTALLAFIVADSEHPDPRSRSPVRTADRLRPALHRLGDHPDDPAGRRRPDVLGLPGARKPRRRAVSERLAGRTVRLPGPRRRELHLGTRRRAEHPRPPADRQPDHLHRAPLVDQARSPDLPGPGEPDSKPRAPTRRPTGCDLQVFNPVLYARPTTNETDSPSGLDLELSAPQFLGFAASPSQLQIGDRDPARRASRSTRTPPTGRRACTDAAGELRQRGPGRCPDNSKIGTFAIGTQALDGPLKARSTSANRSRATSTGSS